MKIIKFFAIGFLLNLNISAYNIGLCIVATGRYSTYIAPLITSAQKFFCKNQNVFYFVFTDGDIQETENIKKIYQKKLGWPYDSMFRFDIYLANKEKLKDMDYIFSLDADMLFVDGVGDEILSYRVGTQHFGFVNKRGTFETNPRSTAYVGINEGERYYAGAFYGGENKEFFAIAQACSHNIHKDLEQNFIAIWHDESHLNRYFIDHQLTKVLDPSYCCSETWCALYKIKLLSVDKNIYSMRETEPPVLPNPEVTKPKKIKKKKKKKKKIIINLIELI